MRIAPLHRGVHVRRLAAVCGLASERADALNDFTQSMDEVLRNVQAQLTLTLS